MATPPWPPCASRPGPSRGFRLEVSLSESPAIEMNNALPAEASNRLPRSSADTMRANRELPALTAAKLGVAA